MKFSLKSWAALSMALAIMAGISSLFPMGGCANIVPPSGGPRDSLPPVLVESTTPDSSLHFQEESFTFTFDEYVDVKDIQQNLVVSPVPQAFPVVTGKLRTVTVKLKDSLEPNTTYTFDFGNAIRDVNEGNPVKNFTYMFSTGSYFDSLTLSGRVVMAETGKADSTLTILLHTSGEDSAVAKNNPRYITKPDRDGVFRFRNLPADTFWVYALKNDGPVKKYFGGDPEFAFSDEPFITGTDTAAVRLYAFKAPQARSEPAFQPAPAAPRDQNAARLIYRTDLQANQQDLRYPLKFIFDKALKTYDPDKIHLSLDSGRVAVPGVSYQLDSTRKELSLLTRWQEGSAYQLILEKEFATDSLDQQLLRADTVRFKTHGIADYGLVRIRVSGVSDTSHPVLLILQNDRLVESLPLENGSITIPLFLPGEYEVRLLIDRNQNGKWDTGNFFGGRLQPERVIPFTTPLKVKANWENEVEYQLSP